MQPDRHAPLADVGAPPRHVLTYASRLVADLTTPEFSGFVDTLGALGILEHALASLLPEPYLDALDPEIQSLRRSLLRAIERGVDLETMPRRP